MLFLRRPALIFVLTMAAVTGALSWTPTTAKTPTTAFLNSPEGKLMAMCGTDLARSVSSDATGDRCAALAQRPPAISGSVARSVASHLEPQVNAFLNATAEQRPSVAPGRMRLGLVGPYSIQSLAQAARAGVSIGLVEMSWRLAEPSPGVYDRNYLIKIYSRVTLLRALGFGVSLNIGLHDAPNWLLDRPGARFVDQYGEVYRQAPVPNLVFGTQYRPLAVDYLRTVLTYLGTDFTIIRAGGGYWGELTYPYLFNSDGKIRNLYWAYDVNAARQSPVGSWRPGDASPHGEARKFLNWYLDRLVEYQNWQVTALRQAGYAGRVAMLYPSWGMRPGDFEAAVRDNLNGTSPAEVNGEVQRGYDQARQIRALTDPNVVVYSTWGEQLPVVTYLARLAARKGLPMMAENAGNDSQKTLDVALTIAVSDGLSAFFLIRAEDLVTRTPDGGATLAATGSTYLSLVGG